MAYDGMVCMGLVMCIWVKCPDLLGLCGWFVCIKRLILQKSFKLPLHLMYVLNWRGKGFNILVHEIRPKFCDLTIKKGTKPHSIFCSPLSLLFIITNVKASEMVAFGQKSAILRKCLTPLTLKMYNRSIRANKVVYEALLRMLLEKFQNQQSVTSCTEEIKPVAPRTLIR